MFNLQMIPQLMQQMRSMPNPMALVQQQFGSNPLFGRAQQMLNGKNPEQIKQVFRNMAQQRGMNDEQLNQFLGNFGLHL